MKRKKMMPADDQNQYSACDFNTGDSVIETLPKGEIARRVKEAARLKKNAIIKRLLQRITGSKVHAAAKLYTQSGGCPVLPAVVEIRASEQGMTRSRLFTITNILAYPAVEGEDIVRHVDADKVNLRRKPAPKPVLIFVA